MLNTQEHADLVAHFERFIGVKGDYAAKEPKDLWHRGHIYCHGPTNDAFLAFRHGYAYGKSVFSSTGEAVSIDELLAALDALYRYASDDGCPHAECHRFTRPNRARLVVETWLAEHQSATPAPSGAGDGRATDVIFAIDPIVATERSEGPTRAT